MDSKIIEKLEKIEERLGSIDKTLVKQEENLAEHMRRTHILEEEIKPIKRHVEGVQAVGKFLLFLGACATLLFTLKKLFEG